MGLRGLPLQGVYRPTTKVLLNLILYKRMRQSMIQ